VGRLPRSRFGARAASLLVHADPVLDGKVLGPSRPTIASRAAHYARPQLIEQVTHLASIAIEREQAEEVLREQASLLDLTHDTVFVRDMNDVITYWTAVRATLRMSSEQAIGKVTHRSRRRCSRHRLAEINVECSARRWRGAHHTKRDGRRSWWRAVGPARDARATP